MSLLFHSWDNSLRNDERSIEVDINNLTEILKRHLGHRNTLDDTSVINKDVDNTKFLVDVCNHCIYLLFISNIADVAMCLNTLCLIVGKSLIHVMLRTAIERNLCACIVQSLSHGKTYAISSSCNEGYLAFE